MKRIAEKYSKETTRQHSFVSILMVLFLVLALGAQAQLSNYCNLKYKIDGLLEDSDCIVRTVDSSCFVTLSKHQGGYPVFSYYKSSLPHVSQLPIPQEYTITDFRIVKDRVVFCGQKQINYRQEAGVIGMFNLPLEEDFDAVWPIQTIEDQSGIQRFNRLTAYLYEQGGCHIQVAAIGVDENNHYSMATVKIPFSTTVFTDYENWPFHFIRTDSIVEGYDITNTQNFVAVVGKRYLLPYEEVYLDVFRFTKEGVASLAWPYGSGQYFQWMTFPYNVAKIEAIPNTDHVIIAYPWENMAGDYLFFYNTVDLTYMNTLSSHRFLLDREMNLYPGEMAYCPGLSCAVSIYDSPLMDESRMLLYYPYNTESQYTHQYFDPFIKYHSINPVLDRYVVMYSGNIMFIKEINEPHVLRDTECNKIEEFVLPRLIRLDYNSMTEPICRPIQYRPQIILCMPQRTEAHLICNELHVTE